MTDKKKQKMKEERQKEKERREKESKKRNRISMIAQEMASLYSRKLIEPIVLLALTLAPNGKFVSRQFILSLFRLSSFELSRQERYHLSHGIMQVLSRLSRLGLIECHSLLRYRMKQSNHDKEVVYGNWDFLVSAGIVTEEQQYRLNPEDMADTRGKLSADQKARLGWINNVETEGRKKLESFVQNSVAGPVVTVGARQTQSVFRLTKKGREKLKGYEKGGIIDIRSPEEKLLDKIFGRKTELEI